PAVMLEPLRWVLSSVKVDLLLDEPTLTLSDARTTSPNCAAMSADQSRILKQRRIAPNRLETAPLLIPTYTRLQDQAHRTSIVLRHKLQLAYSFPRPKILVQ
ncbi:hypothetical protein, partial [Caballeronia sp. GAWG2-1]|uniref:hypothetical protein n=1 Tax=Caballeronia sp. GAWG2-1 TaxID=2921744 RepID=UPI0020298EF2